jgi:hypothetical protein
MDKMDQLLHSLPGHVPSPELAAHIQSSIRRRHHRKQALRWTMASVLTIGGLWLISPAAAWLSSSELYSAGTPWLVGIMDYLNLESVQLLEHSWNDLLSLQDLAGSSLVVSIWIGALLLCIAMFFAIDRQVFQIPSQPYRGIRHKIL